MQSLPTTRNTKATRGAANHPSPRHHAPIRGGADILNFPVCSRTEQRERKENKAQTMSITQHEQQESLTCPVSALPLLQERRGEATSGKRCTVHSSSDLRGGDPHAPVPRMRTGPGKGSSRRSQQRAGQRRPQAAPKQEAALRPAPRSAPSPGVRGCPPPAPAAWQTKRSATTPRQVTRNKHSPKRR